MSKLKKNSKLKEKTQNSRQKLKKSALLGSLGAGKASKKSLPYETYLLFNYLLESYDFDFKMATFVSISLKWKDI